MALCPTGLTIKKLIVQIKKLLRNVSICMSLGFTIVMSFLCINGVCERECVWCMTMCMCAWGVCVVVCVFGEGGL
jgi:hypothetical protein